MPTKIAYRTATLERSYRARRTDVWSAVVRQVEDRRDGVRIGVPPATMSEAPLSTEPPWRHVARLDGDHGSNLCQTTITIRDDGDTCLLSWSCLIDPTDVDPPRLDQLVVDVTEDGRSRLDALTVAIDGVD